MSPARSVLGQGFASPVVDAQRTFRLVLDAMANPGRIVEVPEPAAAMPLREAQAALCLTLLDFETPVWLGPGVAGAADWLRFHCGCPLVADPAKARFAVLRSGSIEAPLSAFDPGEDEYPERSATLLIEVEALGSGTPLQLRGPGVPVAREMAVVGLPEPFWGEWEANAALFPRGVDLVLTAGRRLAALPRTISVET